MTVLIAGGGLAGGAAACLLGPAATLIEREPGAHHKICGEFISWEAQAALRDLGVDPFAHGAARIGAVRLVHGVIVVRADLPGQGAGLSRFVLDEAVLAQAARRGATILRGHAVREITPRGLRVDGLGELRASRVLLATGKHDLRGNKRLGPPEDLIGLKMLFRLAPEQAAALDGHVEVVLFPGGYAGLQPIERGQANLCLLISRARFEAAGASWPGVLAHLHRTAPHLALRLAAAASVMDRPAAIFRVPYGFVHAPAPSDPAHVFRLGDQAAVIPSFSGDGMAIALHTAQAAATAHDAAAYHAAMRRQLRGQIGRAMWLHRLGQSHPALLVTAARMWPGALAWVARLTRAPGAKPALRQAPLIVSARR